MTNSHLSSEATAAEAPWSHSHEFHLESAGQERATAKVLLLTAGAMIIEIIGGLWFSSMALLADGWHMATHATAFGVTLFAYRYARRHANNPAYSFGTGKVSVLSGFASAVALLFVAVLMVAESVHRLLTPREIMFDAALGVAVFGLLINILSAWLLHGQHHQHHEHDHNIRSAYLHVLTDALTSVLAIVALALGKWLGWLWMDAAMGIVGAALIARWSLQLIGDSATILLDGSASAGVRDAVRTALEAGGQATVTDLHVWRVGPRDHAVIVSLLASDGTSVADYKSRIADLPGLSHISIEINVVPD